MVTVYLTRHGQTVWNLDKRLQGSGNSELTDHGIEQAEQLKKRVDSIQLDTIYTSPLERARKTANIIRGNRNIEIIEVDAFKEISFGEYEGHTEEELLKIGRGKEIKEIFNGNMDIKAPGGESLRNLYDRVGETLENILKNSINKNILIVAHGMTLKAVMNYFNKENGFYKEIMGQASLTKINCYKDEFQFEYINDTSHINKKINSGW
ncbi:MAG: histidine phosphatase family protein [Clostridium paraputrificum]